MTEGAFEARKISYRQTKDGMVIAFAIHPNDVPLSLMNAPIGTIYAIGFREMPEGDQSAAPSADAAAGTRMSEDAAIASEPAAAPKQRRHFSELPRSAQAGMRCAEQAFQLWALGSNIFHTTAPDERADSAADYVRTVTACRESRRELDSDPVCGDRWDKLHARYRAETGQECEQR